tara:strand:+ start:106 stop:453 length:348 start_codon:yes stop_codon:yes gene_type:complete
MANAKKLNLISFPKENTSMNFGLIYEDMIKVMAINYGAKSTQQMIHDEVMSKVQNILTDCGHNKKELLDTFDDWIPEIYDRHILREFFPRPSKTFSELGIEKFINTDHEGGQHGN